MFRNGSNENIQVGDVNHMSSVASLYTSRLYVESFDNLGDANDPAVFTIKITVRNPLIETL